MDPKERHTPGLFETSASLAGDDDPAYLRIVRSSSAGTSMDSYMQSLLQQHQHQQQQQQQHQHKGMIMNTMSPQLPPPAAMSLRARETASMSLKHIFDQQMNNGASSRKQECKSTEGQQMGGFQGTRNQSMPNLRKRVPELDLSFRKTQDGNFAYAQTGFGSPISTPTTTNQGLMGKSPLPINSQLMQHNPTQQAAASARLNPSRQPTAQMTIFYSGNVNVYDDVPADKAHAIMLLAGNSWSSNFRCPALPATTTPSAQTEVMVTKERASSPIKAAPSQQHIAPPMTKTNTNGGGIARNASTPASSMASISLASPPPSPAPAPLADGANSVQAGVPARRPHAGIELPHARKASLARFLEKRKDRVQVQQVNPDQEGGGVGEKGGGEGGESASCNGKPADHHPTTTSSSSKKQRTRSPSPPSRSTSNISNRDNSATTNQIMKLDDESPSQKGILNEHCFFH